MFVLGPFSWDGSMSWPSNATLKTPTLPFLVLGPLSISYDAFVHAGAVLGTYLLMLGLLVMSALCAFMPKEASEMYGFPLKDDKSMIYAAGCRDLVLALGVATLYVSRGFSPAPFATRIHAKVEPRECDGGRPRRSPSSSYSSRS